LCSRARCKLNADFGSLFLDPGATFIVFLASAQMFQHQRGVDWQRRQIAQISLVIHHAAAWDDFLEMHVIFGNPGQIFRVARSDPAAELREQLIDERPVVIEALR